MASQNYHENAKPASIDRVRESGADVIDAEMIEVLSLPAPAGEDRKDAERK